MNTLKFAKSFGKYAALYYVTKYVLQAVVAVAAIAVFANAAGQ